MRKLLFPILAALALSGCSSIASDVISAPPPSAIADKTVLDEQAGTAVELAYKAARVALELAVDTGRLTGSRAAVAQDVNRKAYAAVQVARSAYRTGNAASYPQAAAEARRLIVALLSSL